MQFKVVKFTDTDSLEKSVNFWLAREWEVCGGICMGTSKYGTVFYCQALIKKG